jgi:GntR family transcriptional repressor for pyruvate dehydrogenase complex
LHRQLLTVLVSEIVGGKLEPGAMLPREVDLARDFQVSRGVVRESLRGLEERGLVEVRHGRGATVLAPGRWNMSDADVLAAVLLAHGAAEVEREIVEFRAVVDVALASLAAARAGAEDISMMRSSLDRMARYGDSSFRPAETAYRDAVGAFHDRLGVAGGNQMLARASLVGRRAMQEAVGTAPRPRLHAYYALLDAVERSSPPDAERAMLAIVVTDEPEVE